MSHILALMPPPELWRLALGLVLGHSGAEHAMAMQA